MKKDMISIVVPMYNVEQYIDRCLKSLQVQTLQNFEVIIVDDGSTDSSAKIAESFCADNRFRYVYQKNQGQGIARNTGIAMAQGEFIAFVDSDDWVHADYLKKMLDAQKTYDADVVACWVAYAHDSGLKKLATGVNLPRGIVTDKCALLLKTSFVCWNKLYRTCLIKGIEFPGGIKYEDYAWTPRVLQKAQKIVCIEDVLYYYYQRAGSTVRQFQHCSDMLKAQKILEMSDVAKDYPQVIKRYFVRNIVGSFLWYEIRQNGITDQAKAIIKEAKENHASFSAQDVHSVGKLCMPFAILVLHGKCNLAQIYVYVIETVRKLYHFACKKSR